MKIIRHGDIGLHQISKIEGEILKHNGSFVLAEGETTGHKHVITVPRLEDMEVRRLPDGSIMLSLKEDGYIIHEEHKKLIVKRGNYKVVHEREYDYYQLQSNRVQD